MANVKWTEFPAASTISGSDLIPIVQSGTNKKATGAIFSTYIGTLFVGLTGNQTIAGVKTFSSQITSSLATGTAPFSVASTTKVTNLNADLLDGYTSADFQLALTNPITGTGTTNYLPKFTGTSALGNSNVFDDGTNVGIGTTSPVSPLTINGSVAITTGSGFLSNIYYSGGWKYIGNGSAWANFTEGTGGDYVFYSASNNTSGANASASPTEKIRFTNGGNVLIGTTTDAGYKLDVNGTARFSGDITISKNTAPSVFLTNTVSGGINYRLLSADDGTFRIQRTGIADLLTIASSGAATFSSSVKAASLNIGNGIDWPSSASIATFKQASSTDGLIVQETGAGADRVIILNSNGDEQTIESTYRDTGPYGNLVFKTGGAERMRITSDGQVAINTTSPNASAKVQIDSTTQGFLVPRMGDADINSISSPAAGLMVYNTDINHMCMFDGSVWKKFSMSNM